MIKNKSLILSLLITLVANFAAQCQQLQQGTLDRKKIVQRNNFHITDPKSPGPTQVGNGNFAYGFDVTGMQTFRDDFTTMSQWSWHSTLPPEGFTAADFKKTEVNTSGRMVPYDLPNPSQPDLTRWLASNPHRFNLGKIGLWLKKEDGTSATINDLKDSDQYFDLWTAVAVSTFTLEGQTVKVTTVSDPDKDIVAFKIESPLISIDRLGVFINFPYANLGYFSNGSDYNKQDAHNTVFISKNKNEASFQRTLDTTNYQVSVRWSGNSIVTEEKKHLYKFLPAGGNSIEYVFCFNASDVTYNIPSFSDVLKNSQHYWPVFWNSGGCVDLSESKDKRWIELERLIVLSQYIMKINASGNYPPQETGLVNNSWYGRFHYEMIWWHNAHYALWNRWPLLNNSLHVYQDNLEKAKARAFLQGYEGARFPKCTGPDGREWPDVTHAFLVWQQPHPIFFAYLDYRAHPTKATLQKWSSIVEASADFLASFPYYDSTRRQYVLNSPIDFVPENNDVYKDKNPAFELSYWRFGLRVAQFLRKKEGLPEKPLWNQVYNKLASIPQNNHVYEQWEAIDSMWTKFNFEHPALLGIYGMLPGDGVDVTVMKRTFQKVLENWRFDTGWGWDFPLAAMTAARLHEPEQAINMLLHPSKKNNYDTHGFVGGGNPYPYLPTNGGLLYAVAMMTAGWDGDQNKPEPGFPKDGSWVVKWEGLEKAP